MTVGVLAWQGAIAPHLELLARLGIAARPVCRAEQLAQLEGLVLPGGESSVQRHFIERFGLGPALDAYVASGKPLLATCAGVIVCACRGYLDVRVERNAYGRQIHSFEAATDAGDLRLAFIRAPRAHVRSARVHVLATLRGEPVVFRQGRVWATTGHPELTGDDRLHRLAFASAPKRPGSAYRLSPADARRPTR